MTMNRPIWRRGPELALSLFVATLVLLFIVYPIGAMLLESTRITGPMPHTRLKGVTLAALDVLPPERRSASLERWIGNATEKERVEAMAAAFPLAGLPVAWDTAAAYSAQTIAISASLMRLSIEDRSKVESEYAISLVMLHKRTALAFLVRDRLTPKAFDELRAGVEESRGLFHYRRAIVEPFLRNALLNSFSIAVMTTVCTVALAFALVFAIHRGGTGRPLLVRSMILLPLVAPPAMIAAAMLMLFGRRGLITNNLLDQSLGLIDAEAGQGYGLSAVILAQMLSFLPAAAIVIDSVLRQHDGRLEESAASMGASQARILRDVTFPLAWPGVKRAILLVFMMSLTDFGNPMILGRDIPVASGIVYDEILAFRNTPLAGAMCMLLLLPCLTLYWVLELIGRGKSYGSGMVGSRPELRLPATWRFTLGVLCMAAASFILLIYLTITGGAFTVLWGVDWRLTTAYFSNTGLNIGFAGTGYGSSDRGLGLVWYSLSINLVAAPIGGCLGVLVAYVVDRIRPPGANMLAFVTLIPAILPGLIFGIGYVVAFNAPFGFTSISLSGTAAILIINILFSNMFVGVLAARSAFQRSDKHVEEAGEALGASLTQRVLLVTMPLLKTAFLLGSLYVFIDGLTTLSSVIFLISGDHKLASVAIFNHASSGEFGYAAAKSVVIVMIAGAAMALAWWLERTDRRGRTNPVSTTGTKK